jgi:CDP-diacylglycerol--glycerol-3-phosphate 3-phosphatidyltransferase
VPVIFYLVVTSSSGPSRLATLIFAAAALTDFLDGQLARRTSASSDLGRKLDPVADRVLIGGSVVALAWTGLLPAIGAIIVVGRDFFMILGYKFFQGRGVTLHVSLLGKSYTALLMTALVVAMWGFQPGGIRLGWWMFWLGVAGSLLTAAGYIYGGFVRLKAADQPLTRAQDA